MPRQWCWMPHGPRRLQEGDGEAGPNSRKGTGSKTASVKVTAGGGAGTKAVPVSGVGVRSAYNVSTITLAFGNVASSQQS
jgi:hypothetical protein